MHPTNITSAAEGNSVDAAKRRSSWLWPLRPFTFAVAACVLGIAFVVCFPAVEVPHAEVDRDGKYGPHFGIETRYEHGWPARYASRRSWVEPVPGTIQKRFEHPSAWQPWDGPLESSLTSIFVNLAFWLAIIGIAAVAAQYWRSQRRAVWQLNLRDLLVLTGLVAILVAWFTSLRRENLRERAVLAANKANGGYHFSEDDFATTVPAYLPQSVQTRYGELFGQAAYFSSSGDVRVVGQLPRLLVVDEDAPNQELVHHLGNMPQLEALDFCMANLHRDDGAAPSTILSRFPPMPNLRGINLYETDVTDADLKWLASCPRLEHIDLAGTDIGDKGLEHLSRLKQLRILSIWSDHISDDGCRSIAKIKSLQRLSLNSENIGAPGIMALRELTNLQRLVIRTSAPEADLEALRQFLPQCSINDDNW